jgi:predicted nucleic acid-binding Zn ribbon protein
MDEKKGSLTPLKDVISSLMGDGTLPFNPDDARIWSVWEEVVGGPVARHARPLWIKEGKLRVSVTDPIWLQELGYVEKTIRKKLNGKLGRTAVKRIEFRIASQ